MPRTIRPKDPQDGAHHTSLCAALGSSLDPQDYEPESAKHSGAAITTSRFPEPWRIVEIGNGFAVDDAAGRQLGVFYGRTDPNTAGHTGFLTIDEARQMAVDFAMLPKLLKRTSHRGARPTGAPVGSLGGLPRGRSADSDFAAFDPIRQVVRPAVPIARSSPQPRASSTGLPRRP